MEKKVQNISLKYYKVQCRRGYHFCNTNIYIYQNCHHMIMMMIKLLPPLLISIMSMKMIIKMMIIMTIIITMKKNYFPGYRNFRPTYLTHWDRVTHICVSKLIIIGPDNGWSAQAIIWTNAGILMIWNLRAKFNEISSEIRAFSLRKLHLNMSYEIVG